MAGKGSKMPKLNAGKPLKSAHVGTHKGKMSTSAAKVKSNGSTMVGRGMSKGGKC